MDKITPVQIERPAYSGYMVRFKTTQNALTGPGGALVFNTYNSALKAIRKAWKEDWDEIEGTIEVVPVFYGKMTSEVLR